MTVIAVPLASEDRSRKVSCPAVATGRVTDLIPLKRKNQAQPDDGVFHLGSKGDRRRACATVGIACDFQGRWEGGENLLLVFPAFYGPSFAQRRSPPRRYVRDLGCSEKKEAAGNRGEALAFWSCSPAVSMLSGAASYLKPRISVSPNSRADHFVVYRQKLVISTDSTVACSPTPDYAAE